MGDTSRRAPLTRRKYAWILGVEKGGVMLKTDFQWLNLAQFQKPSQGLGGSGPLAGRR